MTNCLADIDFLTALASHPNKIIFARINVYNKEDKQVLTQFEGKITGGNCNIDGNAVIRRTCSLSMSIENNIDLPDELWALSHNFSLEIGLENTINDKYDPIIWFPMGYYIISGFSANHTASNIAVNISGQDLMAKLNGSMGGTLPHEVDFGVIDTLHADGSITSEKLELKTIMQQAIQQYGNEDLYNITINDLPEYGLELLEYRGTVPLYMLIDKNSKNPITFTLDGKTEVKETVKGKTIRKPIAEISQYYSLNVLDEDYNDNASEVQFALDTQTLYVVKLEYGEVIGYRQTPLTYAGDLILKPGENVTSLLDKIKTMLGTFEYFYDTNGFFVFQKKRDYLQELFSPTNGNIIEPIAITSPTVFDYTDDTLLVSKNATPQINQVKNDFVVWRKKAGLGGGAIDIHARYAIDKKPHSYCSPWSSYTQLQNLTVAYQCEKIDSNFYLNFHDGSVNNYSKNTAIYIINSKSKELTIGKYSSLSAGETFYLLNNKLNNFVVSDTHYFIYQQINDTFVYIDPTLYYYQDTSSSPPQFTKYESTSTISELNNIYRQDSSNKLYEDTKYDWRELIYQMAYDYSQYNQNEDFYQKIQKNNSWCINGKTGYEAYYTDMLAFWRLLYDPEDRVNCFTNESPLTQRYWKKEIFLNPETAIFWFDFLDTGETDLGQYNISKIGRRQKVDNGGKSTNSLIFSNKIPNTLFIIAGEAEPEDKDGYTVLQLPQNMENFIAASSQGISVIEEMNNLIYQHACCAKQISISAIPMYWLQPNTRVHIHDIGDVVITKIQYNLSYNGMMSLTCTKVIDQIC